MAAKPVVIVKLNLAQGFAVRKFSRGRAEMGITFRAPCSWASLARQLRTFVLIVSAHPSTVHANLHATSCMSARAKSK